MLVAELQAKPAISPETQPVTLSIGLSERPIPSLPEGGALLELTGCGLCGSDLDKLLNAKAPAGTVLGHEVVGIITALHPDHDSPFKVGDRITTAHHTPCEACQHCLNDSESMCAEFKASNISPGGFAQTIALTKAHLHKTAFKVPDTISDAEASCVEPLACVVRAVRRSQKLQSISNTTQVTIIGLGFIGLMAAQCYKNLGAQVTGLDRLADRIQLATDKHYVSQALSDSHQLAPGQSDIVFLSAVSQTTLNLAMTLVRNGGTIVLFTSAMDGATINPNELYFREINLLPSYSPALQDLKEAARLVFTKEIEVAPLVTHQKSLAELNEAVTLYRTSEAIKVLITP